jgi:environmental stress-induced protein Ves
MILAKNTLDFFSLAANLNTSGKDDYLDKENSKNVTLTQLFQDYEFQGNEEFASAFIGGSLQRSFANKTNLTLLAVRRSQARVTAEEPTMNAVSLFSLALIAIGKKTNIKQLITKK